MEYVRVVVVCIIYVSEEVLYHPPSYFLCECSMLRKVAALSILVEGI